MKKTLLVLLILLTMSLFLVGCDLMAPKPEPEPKHEHEYSLTYDETNHFNKCDCGDITDTEAHLLEWVVDKAATNTIKGTKHLECSCGYRAEENTPIPIEKNEDGTLKLDETLIHALSEYLRDFYACYDIPASNFGWKIELCKSNRNPILVEFGDRCYYVAAYYNASHDLPENFCCYDKYTWVGFEKADEILERWDGKAFVAAFQINPADFCKNIKTDETDYLMEHFTFFTPEFENGKALSPDITFEELFILLTESDEKVIYYSSEKVTHGVFSFDCIELDGEYYVKQQIGTRLADGTLYEHNLELAFGEYYDDLMGVMITGKYGVSIESGSTHEYGLISVSDLASCINKQNDSTQENTSDKQNLIAQIKQDFGSDTVEFTASPFAQEATLSYGYSIDVRIAEDGIYLNGILYDSVKIADNSKIIHDEMILDSANKAVSDEECDIIIEKLRSFENCYLFETESGEAISQLVAVYKIDGKYYFSSFWSEIEGMVIRIHFAHIGKEE